GLPGEGFSGWWASNGRHVHPGGFPMPRRHRPLALAFVLLAGTAIAALAASKSTSGKFTESTATVVVEVPVQVVRDGQPVRGLTKDDFQVYDGRRQQTITGFDVV